MGAMDLREAGGNLVLMAGWSLRSAQDRRRGLAGSRRDKDSRLSARRVAHGLGGEGG